MGLSIFSFDLASLINNLTQFAETIEEDALPIVEQPAAPLFLSPDPTARPTTSAETTAEAIIEDILLAAVVTSAAMTTVSPDAILKKESEAAAAPAKTVLPANTAAAVDEEYRKAIEQLIRSLQTSVVHSYQSVDIVNESVSLKTVANVPRDQAKPAFEYESERTEDERKRKEDKLRALREEFKRSMLKNNSHNHQV